MMDNENFGYAWGCFMRKNEGKETGMLIDDSPYLYLNECVILFFGGVPPHGPDKVKGPDTGEITDPVKLSFWSKLKSKIFK